MVAFTVVAGETLCAFCPAKSAPDASGESVEAGEPIAPGGQECRLTEFETAT